MKLKIPLFLCTLIVIVPAAPESGVIHVPPGVPPEIPPKPPATLTASTPSGYVPGPEMLFSVNVSVEPMPPLDRDCTPRMR